MQIKTLYKKDIHQGSLILVNQHYPFSFSHINLCFFQDTVHQIQMDAFRLLHQCLNHLHIQDEIIVASAYRSALEQKQLYQESLKKHGQEFTQKYVAKAHHSEHETGLAIDLALNKGVIDEICPDFPEQGICQKFRHICGDFGFIERYQKDKEKMTGISGEAWHFRYVGFPHSLIMNDYHFCLEEYHDFLKCYSIYHPYVYVVGQRVFEIFYVPMMKDKMTIALRNNDIYQVSGNNMDGFIVTVWRRSL